MTPEDGLFSKNSEGDYQRVLDASGKSFAVASAIQEILSILDPLEVCEQAGYYASLLSGSYGVAVAFKNGTDHRIVAICYHGKTQRNLCGTVVPEGSITSIIEKERRPVFWIEGEGRTRSPWLRGRCFLGVPIIDEEGKLFGTIVMAYEDEANLTEENALVLEMFASALYRAYVNAVSYSESFLFGQRIEQERLAQKLHDSAAQNIFIASMKINEIKEDPLLGEKVRAQLDELSRIVANIRSDLKSAIIRTNDHAKEVKSIGSAIEGEAARHRVMGGVPVAVYVEQSVAVPDTAVSLAGIIVKEALTNIRKHAHASKAYVSFKAYHGFFHLLVEDDGVGLQGEPPDEDSNGLHFGLSNLHRLVVQAGGTFRVETPEEGHGTTVIARIPQEIAKTFEAQWQHSRGTARPANHETQTENALDTEPFANPNEDGPTRSQEGSGA